MKYSKTILVALIIILPNIGSATPLNNLSLYYRCYAHLTQERPDYNAPLTQAVENGTTNPIDACLQVLNRARFTSNDNRIGNANDRVAKQVLRTMHNLHFSFFENKDIPVINNIRHHRGTQDLYDITTPALYLTRALFRTNHNYSTVVTDNKTLVPIRTNMSPNRGPASNLPESDYIFTNFNFAAKGDLLGVRPMTAAENNLTHNFNGGGVVQRGRTVGGGLLGTTVYNLMSLNENDNFRANSLNMPRKWARAVFNDMLCRELPVVRNSDAEPFVNGNAGIEFRKTSSCTSCHASMDRMAAANRNVRYTTIGNSGTGNRPESATFIGWPAPTLGPESSWPANIDNNYWKRPTNGVLYYRNHNGNLIDINVTSVQDLGNKLATQPDLYICAAKKYYKYFLGVDVNIGDLNDPGNKIQMNPTEALHRQNVVTLGLRLQNHQTLRTMIQEIMNLPEYRNSNYTR